MINVLCEHYLVEETLKIRIAIKSNQFRKRRDKSVFCTCLYGCLKVIRGNPTIGFILLQQILQIQCLYTQNAKVQSKAREYVEVVEHDEADGVATTEGVTILHVPLNLRQQVIIGLKLNDFLCCIHSLR